MANPFRLNNMQIDGTGTFSFWCWLWMSYSLLEWFSVISLILNFSRLLLIKAGLNRLKLIKATGWHKFNLSRLFSNPAWKLTVQISALFRKGAVYPTYWEWSYQIFSNLWWSFGILWNELLPWKAHLLFYLLAGVQNLESLLCHKAQSSIVSFTNNYMRDHVRDHVCHVWPVSIQPILELIRGVSIGIDDHISIGQTAGRQSKFRCLMTIFQHACRPFNWNDCYCS